MSYGVKYRMLYKNTFGELQKVDFLVKDYSGSIENIIPGANPFVIENNKDVSGDYLGSITITKYRIEAISTETFNSFEFDSENYGDIVIAKYDHENNLEAYGIVSPFETQDKYEQFGAYAVSIGAECGLSYLKTIAYFDVDNDAPYTGKSKLIDIIYRCLNQIPYPEQFGLKSINNTIIQVGTTIVNEDLDFYQTATDNEVFQLTLYSYDNCYNVLKQVIGEDCELFFSNGFWWIRNIPELGQSGDCYLTTYTNEGAIDSRDLYDKTGLTVSHTNDIIPLKDGIWGKTFSQKDVQIKTLPPFLINYLQNPNFSKTAPIIGLISWNGDGLGDDIDLELGGSGTESDPFYAQINGSVYSPELEEVDAQYIESSEVTFYPFGQLGSTYIEPQNLLLSGKVEIGTMIKALRLQLIVTNNADVSYYLNNDDTWQTEPTFYFKEISETQRKGEFSIELPSPPPPEGTIDFEVAYLYSFAIRIFRGEQLYENSGTATDIRTFFVKLFQININKRPSLYKEAIEGKTELFVADKYSDRESKKTIEVKLGQSNYPYAYGSIYADVESDAPITGFYYFNDLVIPGLSGSPYSMHMALGYLKVLGKRLKYVDIPVFGKVTYSDLLSIQGDHYRIVNFQYNERSGQSSIKAIELSYDDSIGVFTKDTAFLQNSIKPVGISESLLLEKGRATAKGDNFTFSIDDLGKKYFSVNNSVRLNSIVPREGDLLIGDTDPETITKLQGRTALINEDGFLGEFVNTDNTDDRTYTFPDADITINDWEDFTNIPFATEGEVLEGISDDTIVTPAVLQIKLDDYVETSIDGTANYLAKFDSTGHAIADSNITDDGAVINIGKNDAEELGTTTHLNGIIVFGETGNKLQRVFLEDGDTTYESLQWEVDRLIITGKVTASGLEIMDDLSISTDDNGFLDFNSRIPVGYKAPQHGFKGVEDYTFSFYDIEPGTGDEINLRQALAIKDAGILIGNEDTFGISLIDEKYQIDSTVDLRIVPSTTFIEAPFSNTDAVSPNQLVRLSQLEGLGGASPTNWANRYPTTEFENFNELKENSDFGFNLVNGSALPDGEVTGLPGDIEQGYILALGVGNDEDTLSHRTYLGFGRPSGLNFDGKLYARGVYGDYDSGWLPFGGGDMQDYDFIEGEIERHYHGYFYEQTATDATKNDFIGLDKLEGLILEMKRSPPDVEDDTTTTYRTLMSNDDGRLYFVTDTEKKKYLTIDEVPEGSTVYEPLDPIRIISTGEDSYQIGIYEASGSSAGALSAANFNVFNNKMPYPSGGSDGYVLTKSGSSAIWSVVGAGGKITELAEGDNPLTLFESGDTYTLGIDKATASTDGYLDKDDWTIFNNKMPYPSGGSDGEALVKNGDSAEWYSGFLSDGSKLLQDGLIFENKTFLSGSPILPEILFQTNEVLSGIDEVNNATILLTVGFGDENEISIAGNGNVGVGIRSETGHVIITSGSGYLQINGIEFDMTGFGDGKVLTGITGTKCGWV